MKRMASILVVDDDTLTLDLLTIVLQRHGYFFSVAKDGHPITHKSEKPL
jgi:CheY-like chemotaxis protein